MGEQESLNVFSIVYKCLSNWRPDCEKFYSGYYTSVESEFCAAIFNHVALGQPL